MDDEVLTVLLPAGLSVRQNYNTHAGNTGDEPYGRYLRAGLGGDIILPV
jgi:hypothetical protein